MNKEISQNKHKFYKNNTSQKINHPTNPNAHINSFNGSQNSKM